MRIRVGGEADLDTVRDVELAAGGAFRDLGMDVVADAEVPPAAWFRTFARDGRLLVAVDRADRPVAFVLVEPVDGNAHIEQVSVHPSHARRGVGRALIDHVAERAAAKGMPALTLTTFAEVPWNAPYYERCGFRRLAPEEETPGLRAIRAREAATGLDRWPRLCMRREVRVPGGAYSRRGTREAARRTTTRGT